MRTFPYAKLRKAAKAIALEDWRTQDNWHWFDDEDVKDDFIELGKERGFEIDRIYWSGFWSQGDGASWEGSINVQKWLAYHTAKQAEPSTILMALEALMQDAGAVPVLAQNTHHCHENTMRLIVEFIDWDMSSQVVGGIFDGANCEDLYCSLDYNFPEQLLEDARAYAREIYKALEAEYEFQTSEEYFAEMCDANDWVFNARGQLVRK